MDKNLLCTWLNLPAGIWPPNHYDLLGLTPGEHDARLIEDRVHERMQIVRQYQLASPDLATEAMNRLAQAMICLTDDGSRQAYYAQLFPDRVGSAATAAAPVPTPVLPTTQATAAEPAPVPAGTALVEAPKPPALSATDRAVHTRRDLYYRIARTRQIQHLWEQVGTYLNNPRRRLSGPAEALDLIHHMQALPSLIASFPFRFGQAGAPGYLVLALARQQLIVPTLQTLLPSQRVALARDWENGRQFLASQKAELRKHLDARRRRGGWDHVTRLARSILNNHPGLVMLASTLVALNLTFPDLRRHWPSQACGLGCLALLNLILWWAKSRYTRLHLPARPARPGQSRRSKGGAVPASGPKA